jgi:chromosome condensin MukBEF complex kleisin-like MukF subunit
MVPVEADLNSIAQLRVDIAKIEGMLTPILQEMGRRLNEHSDNIRQLRVDLTAVNDQAQSKISEISTNCATNANAIENVKKDITEIYAHQDRAASKSLQVITGIAAFGSLVISFIFDILKLNGH